MNFEVVRRNFERYGAIAGVHDVAKKAVNRVVPVRVLRGLRLVRDRLAPTFLDLPAGFRSGLMSESELLAHAEDPSLDLSAAFVRSSLASGDRCFGITKDDALVSYGWYASRPTPISESLSFHFDPAYVYMYKGFTRPEHRGHRLHAVGMAQALVGETERGSKGILSYVESNNFASLRSCFRMGYEPVGTILILTVNGRTHSFATPGCRRYRLDVRSLTN
jgi:hypothetical protein